MYWFKAPILIAALFVFGGAPLFGQSVPDYPTPDEAGQIESVGYLVADEAYDGPSCCETEPDACCGSADCNSGGGRPCRFCRSGELGDPWTLFPENRRGVAVGGWLSAGIYGNAHGATSNGPLGFNDVGDGFTANQLWIYAEKVADTGGCGTDWGFRVDYVFGVDGPDTQAFGGLGWDNEWDTARDYGSALPQLYAEFAAGDLSIKLGHFYTLIGQEVVSAPNNFFYSHAYTNYYGEPFTHTGVLATYNVSDGVAVYGGWTQGWDTGFDNTPRANTFLGGVSMPLSERATVIWAVSAGDFGVGAGDIYMNSIVLTLALSDKLTYILEHDLGTNSALGAGNNEWYGINQYMQYELNDCWAAGIRIEWFRDDDGARISFNGAAVGNYYELTAGLNWRPHTNVVLRPEVRYDWFDGTAARGALPYNDGASSDQFSGGFDLIFTF